jgi:RimJ/RimL family protein N-acetyltransferase
MPIAAPPEPLTDGELRLRPPHAGDADAFARACADPELALWVWPPPEDPEVAGRRLLQDLIDGWQERTATFVELDSSGELAGVVSLMVEHDPAVAEVAIWIAPHARRRGLGTRLTRLVANWAHRERDIARLWIEIDRQNTASHRIAERLGFVREGVLRSHCFDRATGGRRDCVVYSLLPEDLA